MIGFCVCLYLICLHHSFINPHFSFYIYIDSFQFYNFFNRPNHSPSPLLKFAGASPGKPARGHRTCNLNLNRARTQTPGPPFPRGRPQSAAGLAAGPGPGRRRRATTVTWLVGVTELCMRGWLCQGRGMPGPRQPGPQTRLAGISDSLNVTSNLNHRPCRGPSGSDASAAADDSSC